MTSKQPTDIFIGAVIDSKSLNGDKYEFVETPFADVKIPTPIPGVRSKIIVPAYEKILTALGESIVEAGGELNGDGSFYF